MPTLQVFALLVRLSSPSLPLPHSRCPATLGCPRELSDNPERCRTTTFVTGSPRQPLVDNYCRYCARDSTQYALVHAQTPAFWTKPQRCAATSSQARPFALLFRFPRRVKRVNRHQVLTEQRPSSQRAAFTCFLELCHPASAVASPRRKPVWVEVGSGQQLAASAKLRGLHVSRPKCYVHETAPASFERPATCLGSLS